MTQAKNFIIITSDELRGDCTGFMGNEDIRTPNLDAFAQSGVVFTNHFTVHGKCVPSRIAMMDGRYSHTDGYRTVNKTNLMPSENPDLMKTLRDKGYEVAKFGHNHVWDDFENQVHYHSFSPEFEEMAKKEWDLPPADPNGPEPLEELNHVDYGGRMTGKWGGFHDRNRTAQAIKYLKDVRSKDKPFFMYLNIGRPHPQYAVEEPYYSMYDRQAIKAWPHDVPENAPLHLEKQRELRLGREITEAALREIQCVYYGMVTSVDDQMGLFFETAEEEGLFDDTIFIFTADHGDWAGQYGINEKWDTAMQDCILHVPLVLKAPGLPEGKRVDVLTEHVDIPKTVMELLGVEPAVKWVIHGDNLLPAIKGEKIKDAVFADGGHEAPMRARFDRPAWQEKNGRQILATGGKQRVYKECPDAMARTKMIRTEKWKLVVRETGGDELYDLEKDPDEMKNLFGNEKYHSIVMNLQRRLLNWCLRTDTDRPFQPTVGA